jgi:Glutaredoxin
MSAAHVKAQRIIDDNAVAFFSKSYCPYCKASKQLLTEMGANFYAIELDQVGTSPTSHLRLLAFDFSCRREHGEGACPLEEV